MIAKVREQIGRLNTLIRNDANLGEGFEIGHSYFCAGDNESAKPWANDPSAWINEIMKYELEPLLREYWYDDKEQLQAALQLLAMD
jgi:5-methylcytosine-specific restriction protein B